MQIKTLSISKTTLANLTVFGALLSFSIATPLFHFQPITGPLVNGVLFLGAALLPIEYGFMLCLLPSLVALSVGTLPIALAPMIPFIMFGNAILVVSFRSLRRKNFFLALVSASFLKFAFLFSASFIILRLIAQKPIAQKIAAMMSWPQLITALIGGCLAFLTLKFIKKYDRGF